jgi:hypothetical protein
LAACLFQATLYVETVGTFKTCRQMLRMSVYRCRLKRRRAALRTAIDLVHEQLITPQQALQRFDGIDLTALVQISLVSADKP